MGERDADIVHLNAPGFPENVHISLTDGVAVLGRRPLHTPHTIYLRGLACHPLSKRWGEELPQRPHGLIAQTDEIRAHLESLLRWAADQGARCYNSLEANAQHSRKPLQLLRLQAAGVRVPRWCASNDPDVVRPFVAEVGAAVYKPLAGGAAVEPVSADDLSDARLAALRHAPVLFQARLYGENVRVYVVEQQVVASVVIESNALDYRTQPHEVRRTTLSPVEHTACLRAARACGMTFAGVDLIRDADSPHVLECNPSPMFVTVERRAGCDIAGPLADALCSTHGVGAAK